MASRDISTNALRQMNEVTSSEPFLLLLSIATEDLTTYRVVNNNTDVVSNSITYTAYPFMLTMENQDGNSLPTFKLTIDNIDRLFVQAIRGFASSPTVVITMVAASNPDVYEIVTPYLQLVDATYDAFTITGTLIAGDILNQRFPKDRYTPNNVPGLF